VTERALMSAVEAHGRRDLNFAEAARALGVSEAALRAALPPPPPR
jgi:DNA-binding Lrp family transcriptional regulator